MRSKQLKRKIGVIIKIGRETEFDDNHISEFRLKTIDQSYIDYEIDNNFTLEDLYSQLDTIILVPF